MRKIIYFLIFFFIFLLIIPLININGSSHFFYREITSKKISEDLKSTDKITSFLNIFEFIYYNMESPNEGVYLPLIDENASIDLIRGYGHCDEQAFVLMNLINKLGFNSRLRDVQAHTFSEVLIENKWIIADPYFGLLFLNNKNKMLNLEDLYSNNNFLIKDYYDLLSIEEGKYTLEYFKNIYAPNNTRWKEGKGPIFHHYRAYNNIRNIYEKFSTIIYNIFGDYYYFLYQDLYLYIYSTTSLYNPFFHWNMHIDDINNLTNLVIENDLKAFELFFIGRNYDLSNRVNKAIKYYQKSIAKYPDSFWAKESYYYTGKIYYRNADYEKSINSLNNLNENYPRHSKVNFYLGMNNLKQDKISKAKFFLIKSEDLHSKIILKDLL